MSLTKKIQDMKPFTKILVFGFLPLAVILMVIFKPADSNSDKEINEKKNPFFVNPENQEVFTDKSNIDIYNDKKMEKAKGSTFSNALTFETKTNSEVVQDSIIDNTNSNNIIRQNIDNNSKSSFLQNRGYVNPYEYENKVVEEKTVINTENNYTDQKRRRTGSTSALGKKGVSDEKGTTPIISAVIHNENKEVKGGNTVRIRLSEDCEIGGRSLLKNTVISGIADLSGERLRIDITSISYNGSIFSCNLTIFDNDGLEGLYVPGGLGIGKDVANEGVSQGGTQISVPFIGSIGVSAVKKKMNDPSVKVYDNHKVTLRLITKK